MSRFIAALHCLLGRSVVYRVNDAKVEWPGPGVIHLVDSSRNHLQLPDGSYVRSAGTTWKVDAALRHQDGRPVSTTFRASRGSSVYASNVQSTAETLIDADDGSSVSVEGVSHSPGDEK